MPWEEVASHPASICCTLPFNEANRYHHSTSQPGLWTGLWETALVVLGSLLSVSPRCWKHKRPCGILKREGCSSSLYPAGPSTAFWGCSVRQEGPRDPRKAACVQHPSPPSRSAARLDSRGTGRNLEAIGLVRFSSRNAMPSSFPLRKHNPRG